MKLIKVLVFFMSMDLGESSGKGKSGQKGENDLVVTGGSCPSLPPIDGIECHYDPQPNPNGPSNPNIADYRRERLNMS